MMKSMRVLKRADSGGIIAPRSITPRRAIIAPRASIAPWATTPGRATTRVAPTMDENGWRVMVKWSFVAVAVCMCVLLVGCGSQQQGQKADARLKLFHVLSSRIVILDTQAEVDGMVQNTGKERFPFDVTLVATFYDRAGKVVGQAHGAAEDVFPGMTRPFVLIGQVDSSTYSRMVVTPVNLRERRYEKSLPSPPPVAP